MREQGRLAAVGVLLAVCSIVITSCAQPQDPQQALRQHAANRFETLDATYLNAAQAALRQADPIVPTAFELAMFALASASADFATGLEQIPMPTDSKADAQILVGAARQEMQGALAGQALIASGSTVDPSAMSSWLHTRNDADRQLRKDLHLDPNEAPA